MLGRKAKIIKEQEKLIEVLGDIIVSLEADLLSVKEEAYKKAFDKAFKKAQDAQKDKVVKKTTKTTTKKTAKK